MEVLIVSDDVDSIKSFMGNIDSPSRTPDANAIEKFQEDKQAQIQLLMTQYTQNKLLRSIQTDDSRSQVMDQLVGNLDNMHPDSMIELLRVLNDSSVQEMKAMMQPSDRSSGGVLNMTLNQQVNNTGPSNNANAPAMDTSVIKALSKFSQGVQDNQRIEDQSVDIEKT